MSKVTRRLRSNGADWTETCRKGKNARGAVKAGQDRVFSKIRGKSVEGDPTKGTETIIPTKKRHIRDILGRMIFSVMLMTLL